jgi:hypothetical protein
MAGVRQENERENMKTHLYLLTCISALIFSGCSSREQRTPTDKEILAMQTVRIDVTTKGYMQVNTVHMSESKLEKFISERILKIGRFPVVIRGEQGTSFETLQPVIALCAKTGITSVALRLIDAPIDTFYRAQEEGDGEPKLSIPDCWHYYPNNER